VWGSRGNHQHTTHPTTYEINAVEKANRFSDIITAETEVVGLLHVKPVCEGKFHAREESRDQKKKQKGYPDIDRLHMNAHLKVAEEKDEEDGEKNNAKLYLHKDSEFSSSMTWPGCGQDTTDSKAGHKSCDKNSNFIKNIPYTIWKPNNRISCKTMEAKPVVVMENGRLMV
jgi:hypothetical protein